MFQSTFLFDFGCFLAGLFGQHIYNSTAHIYKKRMLYLGSLRETLGKAFLLSFVCILYVLKAIRLILFIYFHK